MAPKPPASSRPTVSGPRRRATARTIAGSSAAAAALTWLKRESLALIAMSGAAATVFSQLTHVMPASRLFTSLAAEWQRLTEALWKPPLELTGLPIHADLLAALNLALFMTLIGVGARVSARLTGKPLAKMSPRFFDDQTGPSLAIFAALCMVFLLGHDAQGPKLAVWESEELGKYGFALVVTAGYFAGDLIGHREFHVRLYRLAAFVLLLVLANFASLWISGT